MIIAPSNRNLIRALAEGMHEGKGGGEAGGVDGDLDFDFLVAGKGLGDGFFDGVKVGEDFAGRDAGLDDGFSRGFFFGAGAAFFEEFGEDEVAGFGVGKAEVNRDFFDGHLQGGRKGGTERGAAFGSELFVEGVGAVAEVGGRGLREEVNTEGQVGDQG